MVYLQELEFGLGIDGDPISFSQPIESINFAKWIDAMKDKLKSIKQNDV